MVVHTLLKSIKIWRSYSQISSPSYGPQPNLQCVRNACRRKGSRRNYNGRTDCFVQIFF